MRIKLVLSRSNTKDGIGADATWRAACPRLTAGTGESGGFGIKPAGLRGRLWLRRRRPVHAIATRRRTNNRRDCQVVVRTGRGPPTQQHAPGATDIAFPRHRKFTAACINARPVTGRNARNFRTPSSPLRPVRRSSPRYSSPRRRVSVHSCLVIDGPYKGDARSCIRDDSTIKKFWQNVTNDVYRDVFRRVFLSLCFVQYEETSKVESRTW